MPADLDWTLTDAPDPDEMPHPAPKPPPSALTPPGIIWITGLVVLLALLTLGGYWFTGEQRTRRDVENLIAREEQAAREHDTRTYQTLVADDASEWLGTQTRWVFRGLAAPVPLPLLTPVTDSARLAHLTSVSANTLRADVTRQYLTPQGMVITFTLPQFYRYSRDLWQRIAPPDSYLGELKLNFSSRLDLRYYTADAPTIQALAPLVKDVLTQACATWTCPDSFRFSLYFTDPTLTPNYSTPDRARSLDGPLLFDWVTQTIPPAWSGQLYLPTSAMIGYPADAVSAEYYQRLVALQVLLQTAGWLSESWGGPTNLGPDISHNAFFYALVARVGARAGLESPQTLTTLTSSVPMPSAYLWDWGQAPPEAANEHTALQSALATLNRVIDSPATERALFNNLSAAASPTYWFATTLSLTVEAAQMRLVSTLLASVHPAGLAPRAVALGCRAGPALYSPGDSTLTYLFAENTRRTQVAQWSPNGQRFVFFLDDQPLLFDFTTARVSALPPMVTWGAPQWVSDTVLAYVQWPPNFVNDTPTLRFYNIADPTQVFPDYPAIQNYELAPDQTQAAILRFYNAPGNQGAALELMPALGGNTFSAVNDTATYPMRSNGLFAWSPDSRALAYTHLNADNVAEVRVLNLTTGAIETILHGETLALANNAIPTSAALVWSPTAERLGFAAMAPDHYRSWIGLMNPDGSRLSIMAAPSAIFFDLHFSADGQYLAASYYDFTDSGKLAIYDVRQRIQIAFFESVQAYGWSSLGQQMVIATKRGVHWLETPLHQPQRLTADSCESVVWRPRP